jgi:hypothetical protein
MSASDARAKLVIDLIHGLDAPGMARVGAAWLVQLTEFAKLDPREAGKLAAAMFAHLANYRPESPAPLDAGFEPTEIARDPRG